MRARLKFSSALCGILCAFLPLSISTPSIGAELINTQNNLELSADGLTYEPDTNIVIAQGNVVLRHDGYILLADLVRYDQNSGKVFAESNVQITSPDGNVLFLDEVELDDALKEGFVKNVRLILEDGSKLAAKDGVRSGGNKTELNYAVYSPCKVCEETGKTRPLWQIKALRVTHDQEKKRIYYKNAYLEMFGLPVGFLPYFSHPDPTVERASGFLAPEISHKRELGISIGLPYYHVFSKSSDITLKPIINTGESSVLAVDYRKRFNKGTFNLSGSGTYTDERDDFNTKTGHNTFRGHINSSGTMTHNKNWVSNYKINWASDDTYLRRFEFSKEDTLTSRVQSEGFFGRSYVGIQALAYQGLRIEDEHGKTGFALPLVDMEYISKPTKQGLIYKTGLNALLLNRSDGMDTRRVSANFGAFIPFQNSVGQKLDLSAEVRGDMYDVRDSNAPDLLAFRGQDGTSSRFLPHLTATFTWPFAKVGKNATQMIEPIVSFVAAPNKIHGPEIPNEDSRSFELSDANIFSDNRFPGLDRWEGGSRVNYGVTWSIENNKVRAEALVGQSYRVKDQSDLFQEASGFVGHFSDIVGQASISLVNAIELKYRFRLDKDNLQVRRNEIDARFGDDKNYLKVGYFQLNRGTQLTGIVDREEIRASGQFRLKRNWTLFGDMTQNLTNGSDPIAHSVGILYRDECLDLSLAWRRSYTEDRDIVPGSSIMFRISLKHLG